MTFTARQRAIIAAGIAFLVGSLAYGQTRSQGDVTLSTRAFSPDADARTVDQGVSTDFHLDLKAKQTHGFRQQLRLSGRAAMLEDDRSILVINDAWAGWQNRRIHIRLGAETFNWSTAEAFHPTDTMNSRNLDSALENPEKMGEPAVTVRIRIGEGGLTAHYMPLRIAPVLPGRRSRLNFTQGQMLTATRWADRNGSISRSNTAHQFALRMDQTVGQADLTAHFVSHNDRTIPSLLVNQANGEVGLLFPVVHRMGGSMVIAIEDWLVKLEGEFRQYDEFILENSFVLAQPTTPDHIAIAGGFDYGWAYDAGSEGTLLVEAQVLHAQHLRTADMGLIGPFQRDLLIGYRHANNDEDGTEFLCATLLDLERPGEFIGTLTASKRLHNDWKIEGKYQFVRAPQSDSLLSNQDGMHAGYLDFIRSF